MTHEAMIAVISAHRDGKKIEGRRKGGGKWDDCPTPTWDFYDCEFRIKTEPRVIWVNEYPAPLGLHAYYYTSRALADNGATFERIACRKFVEVIE